MVSETFTMLVTLSDTFAAQGLPLQAIKCLLAITQSSITDLPQFEAEVRLKLAKLQKQHTHDLKDVIGNLERALLVLQKQKLHIPLKCDVLSELADTHLHQGNWKLLKNVCNLGIKTCQQAAHGQDRSDLQAWEMHFHGMLTRASQANDEPSTILTTLQTAIARADSIQNHVAKAVFEIGLLQHHLHEPSNEIWDTQYTSAESALAKLVEPSLTTKCAALHLEILRVMRLLARGNVTDLVKTETGKRVPASILKMQQMQDSVALIAHEKTMYEWFSVPNMLALSCIVMVAIWRPIGKHTRILQYLEQAGNFHGANFPARSSPEEDGHEMEEHLLQNQQIEALILEEMTAVALTRSEFIKAGDFLARLYKLHAAHNPPQAGLSYSLHMLSGYYCRSTRRVEEARNHFLKAAQLSETRVDNQLAYVEASLTFSDPALVLGHADIASADHCTELLQKGELYNFSENKEGSARESCLSMYATAHAHLAKGDIATGRPVLLKSLKKAHADLQHHQLVAKIMCTLAPKDPDSDYATQHTMVDTAFKLAHAQADLVGQVMSLQAKVGLKRSAGESAIPNESPDPEEYLKGKRQALELAVNSAVENSDIHEQILAWDPAAHQPVSPSV